MLNIDAAFSTHDFSAAADILPSSPRPREVWDKMLSLLSHASDRQESNAETPFLVLRSALLHGDNDIIARVLKHPAVEQAVEPLKIIQFDVLRELFGGARLTADVFGMLCAYTRTPYEKRVLAENVARLAREIKSLELMQFALDMNCMSPIIIFELVAVCAIEGLFDFVEDFDSRGLVSHELWTHLALQAASEANSEALKFILEKHNFTDSEYTALFNEVEVARSNPRLGNGRTAPDHS
jgi:hypothetical protein